MNFLQKLLGRDINKKYKRGKAFAIALMLSSFYFANQILVAVLTDKVPNELLDIIPFLAIAGAVLVVKLIDDSLYEDAIQSFVAYRMIGWKKMPAGHRAMLIATGVRFLISVTLTIGAVYFIADNATSEVQTQGAKAAQQVTTESATVRKEIASIRAEYTNRADKQLEQARADAERWENEAIDSGGANWARNWRNNSPYYKTSKKPDLVAYRKRIAEAKKKGEKKVAEATAKYDEIMNQMAHQIALVQSTAARSLEINEDVYTQASGKATFIKNVTSGFGWMFDFFFAFMTFFYVLVISEWVKDQENPVTALDKLMGKSEESFFEPVTQAFAAVKDMLMAAFAITASWFSSGSASIMMHASKKIKVASIARAEASAAWQEARHAGLALGQQNNSAKKATTTPSSVGQHQKTASDNTENKSHQQHENHESKRTNQQTAPSPTGQEQAKSDNKYTDNTKTTPDNTGQHRTTDNTPAKTTHKNSTSGTSSKEQRSADVRQARKALNKKKNAYKSRARKYLEKAKAAERAADKDKYLKLAKDNAQKARDIELEITNLESK